MIIMKHFLNLFAILLATVILCTGCEKKSIVDTIAEMYDDGNKKVEEFKQGHLKEMAALDSTFAKIEEAKMTFTKACCIKASSFDGFIKDSNGVVIGINDAGKVSPIESIEENQKKYDVADLARKISEIIDSGDEEKQIRVFREFNRLMTSGVPMEQVTDEMKKHTEE